MKNLHGLSQYKNESLLYMSKGKNNARIEDPMHAILLSRPDGSILKANHIAMNMFGYSKNELLTLNKQELIDHTDENIKLAFESRKQNGYISFEATGIKKNGEHFPIELSSVIYAEPDGEVRTSTMIYDMSNRKYAENQLPGKIENEPDFKQVIESITDGFFTLDNNWIITYWNREIEKISGIKKEDIIGRCFLDFFKKTGTLKLYSECRRSKQENISIRFEEFYEVSNSWIEIDAYPSETGLTVFCKNITEQKRPKRP